MKDDILTVNILRRLACKNKLYSRGNLKPSLADRHTASHIGRADACRKSAERTVCTGMRIRTDYEITCRNESFFGKNRVLNAHIAHVKIIFDFHVSRKFTAHFTLCRRFDILIGSKMIHYHCDLFFIKNFGNPKLFELPYGNGRGYIVSEYQIQIRKNQLTGGNAFKSRVLCQNLLSHCHAHIFSVSPAFWIFASAFAG